MTEGQTLKLKRRSLAKESQESRRQRHQRRRARESKEERQPSLYQQLRGLREPQLGHQSQFCVCQSTGNQRSGGEVQPHAERTGHLWKGLSEYRRSAHRRSGLHQEVQRAVARRQTGVPLANSSPAGVLSAGHRSVNKAVSRKPGALHLVSLKTRELDAQHQPTLRNSS